MRINFSGSNLNLQLKTRLAVIFFVPLFFLFHAESFAASRDTLTIQVSVSQQKLFLLKGDKLLKTYPVSTSRYGTGNREGSNRTPLGRHRIARKIGDGASSGTIFRDRKNTHKTLKPNLTEIPMEGDFITSRILWLEGLERGVNRGGSVDSFKRFIYIHGTPDEGLIGRPASHGCIRMKNRDVIELFSMVPFETPVTITA